MITKNFALSIARRLLGQRLFRMVKFNREMMHRMRGSGYFAIMFPTRSPAKEETYRVKAVSLSMEPKIFSVTIYPDRLFLVWEFLAARYCMCFFDAIKNIFTEQPIESPVVIDAGANVGMFSLVFSSLFREFDPEIVAFEPLPPNIFLLRLNTAKVPCRFAIEECGLGAKVEVDRKMIVISTTGATINQLEAQLYLEQRTRKTVPPTIYIPLTTLDDYAATHLPGRNIALLKMDVEGAEDEILAGSVEVIKAHKPIIIYCYEHIVNDPVKALGFLNRIAPYTAIYHRDTSTACFFPKR
jgi:FkbM family methyltransferase